MNLINRFAPVIFFVFAFSAFGVSKDELTLKAYDAIYDNALTSVNGECLSFDIDESHDGYYFISVKENHSKEKCPGDDSVSAKMFDMKIDKKTGIIYTNEGSDDNIFRQLENNGAQCNELNNIATEKGVQIPSEKSGYKVNVGRSYFYTAPNDKCKNKKLFVVNGDLINSYLNYNGFSSVIYFKKNGESVSGWVHTDSITPTGTGIGPRQ